MLPLSACAAFGQPKSQTFYFTHLDSKGLVACTNAITSIADIRDVSVDDAKKSVTVQGTPDQISIVAWLANELNQTPGPRQALVRHDYTGAVPEAQVVQVFYLANINEPRDLQEVVNMTRSVADLQRFFPVNSLNAIMARGDTADLELGGWILGQVDQPAAALKPGGRDHAIKVTNPRRNDNMAQVYVLSNVDEPVAMQEMINGVRSIAGIQRFFPFNSRKMITMRASTAQVAFADWMLQLLDKPATSASPDTAAHEYQFTEGAWDTASTARVFFLNRVEDTDQLHEFVNQIRTTTRAQRTFPNSQAKAIAMRGTGDQISRAEQMLKDQ